VAPVGAGAVKFLRQFAAVVAVVGVVVLLGMAWNRLDPRLPGEGPAAELAVRGTMVKVPPGVHRIRTNVGGTPGLDLGDLLQPENLAVLRYSAELEAAIMAVVVIASANYRSMRRHRRAKASTPPPVDTDLS
jgi:hypothetical protein